MARRCAGLGRGGRPDKASVTGSRAAARAGHHAAAVVVATASSMPSATRSHGIASRSIRCPANVSRDGAAAIHAARPSAVPATAAMTPTTAPPVTMTIRSCLRVAPIAASMPSWRWRRAAITAKPAAATRETRSSKAVTAPSTPPATAPWVLAPRACHSSGPRKAARKAAKLAGLAFSSTVTDCGGPAPAGETRANWSLRSLGFSTMPVTVWCWPPRDNGEPMRSWRACASWPVTATCPAPAG